jgi:CHAT domain-containing protein
MREPTFHLIKSIFHIGKNLCVLSTLVVICSSFAFIKNEQKPDHKGGRNIQREQSALAHARVAMPRSLFLNAPIDSDLQDAALEFDKPIEREIQGGEKHFYKLALGEKQFARVVVEQRGIDVVVRLLAADGKVLVEYDSDPRRRGEEIVEFASAAAADYRLAVEPRQKNAPSGRYQIHFVEQRPANERDLALNEARKLHAEANRLWRADKYTEARALAERALMIRERASGANDLEVGSTLVLLANIVSDQGDYATAEAEYLRALDIKERALGRVHFAVSAILNNLGVLYKDQGDLAKAEPFFQRALEIREKTLEPDHLLIASVLNNLAIISRARGDDEKAAALYRRTLEIREHALGAEHADVATALNNLANIYSDIATAEPLYLRALAIRERVLGADNPNVAQTLYNLAVLYSSAGDYQRAEPLCRRALAIFEKSLGAEHPFTSYPLNLLAVIRKNAGDYAQAETLYQRSIAIKEKTQSSHHPDLAGTLTNLANLYAIKGETDKAIAAQARANAILEYNIALNIAAGSERQKLAYLKSLADIENETIMLHLQNAPRSQAAADLAATTILQRKGRVLDAVSDNLATLRRRFNAHDQKLLDDLNEVTTKLAGLTLNGEQDDEYKQKIKSLEEKREKLEVEISRRSAGFYEQTKPVTLKDVQAAIPVDAALIEFAVYRPISPKGYEFITDRAHDPNAAGEPRYAVYVIRKQGTAQGRELGAAREIDAAINAFRQALRDPNRKDFEKLARAVDERVMQPVRDLTEDAAHLLVSPDGALNLIPFEALVDERGRFLIERYAVSYLTSGRDLLRLQTARASRSAPAIFADPFFGEPALPQIVHSSAKEKPTALARRRRSITNADDLSSVYFAPLSGTAREAQTISGLFYDANVFTGRDANETALKRVNAPRILHIATHGFFLNDAPSQTSAPVSIAANAKDRRAINANLKVENPLLRSGLALAGANLRAANSDGDDGILTALEASGLNLWGTKLVVLSACDTGVGEVRNGEGVYGLRRAFVLAGSETQVMSLWAVSDYVTRELMTGFYKNLKQGMARGEALRQVKLEMLRRRERQHPFYWASFIQSGEWANLDGGR